MSNGNGGVVSTICQDFGYDRFRMMDIVAAVQKERGYVDGPAMDEIAAAVGAPRVEVEGLVSFYTFFHNEPKGNVVIRLCTGNIFPTNDDEV